MAYAQIGQIYLLWDFIEKTKIWFLSHNFGTSNARKPIKPSKDSDYSLV